MKLGLNKDISNEDYHADREYISSSGLKLLLRDEREYYRKYILGEKDESKSFFDFGTYVHALILEPHIVDDEFAIFGGARRFGKTYDQFCDNNPGKIVITKSEEKLAKKIMESYDKHTLAKSLVCDGVAEETYGAVLDDMNVKIRTDYMTDGYILDVKTTSSSLATPSIQSTIMKYDYDLSAALYMDVANQYGKKCDNFFFLFVNKKDCDILVCKASPALIENGRRKYKAAIAKFKQLKAEGFFELNKEQDDVVTIDLPEWGVWK